MIFMGDDWSEDHHDVYLMDAVLAQPEPDNTTVTTL